MIKRIEKNLTLILAGLYILYSLWNLPDAYTTKENFDGIFNLIPFTGILTGVLTAIAVSSEFLERSLVNLIVDGETKESIMMIVKRMITRLMFIATVILVIITCFYLKDHNVYEIIGNKPTITIHSISPLGVGIQIVKIVIVMFLVCRATFTWTLRLFVKPVSYVKILIISIPASFIRGFLIGFTSLETGNIIAFLCLVIILIVVNLATYNRNIETFLTRDIA